MIIIGHRTLLCWIQAMPSFLSVSYLEMVNQSNQRLNNLLTLSMTLLLVVTLTCWQGKVMSQATATCVAWVWDFYLKNRDILALDHCWLVTIEEEIAPKITRALPGVKPALIGEDGKSVENVLNMELAKDAHESNREVQGWASRLLILPSELQENADIPHLGILF